MGWTRRSLLHTSALGAGAGIVALAAGAPAAAASRGGGQGETGGLRITAARVEYADHVLGTDNSAPLLSWELVSETRGAGQSAYQVRAATDPRDLSRGRRLLWDSGKVASDRTVAVPYGGPALPPRTRCHWQVRVWDTDGGVSRWSTAGWWETALGGEEWGAHWIGADAAAVPPGFDGASWIWTEGATTGDAPAGTRWFRAGLDLPAGPDIRSATVVATADDDFTLHLDGAQVLHAPQQQDGWRTGRTADVTEVVRAADGRVVLAALATNRGGASINPGGLLVRLVVEAMDGGILDLVSDGTWVTSETGQQGWEQPDFDDSGWQAATVLVPYGEGPWGKGVSVALPEAPAPLLRRQFAVRRPVSRARLYICGLAYYVAELNGRRIGEQVLDPAFTDYDETVMYAVHDVTDLLRRGENVIGVTLGRGFYGMTTPNVWNWHTAPWHSEPRLLCRLEVEHTDGSHSTVVSDTDWRITEGPTPTDISELRPGVHVVDMGRTTAGWTRLTVRAPAGTKVSLVHGEKLKDDGSVHAETGHVPGRFQRDEYICAGGGKPEVWEPSFSYKGFRYVQIEGLPTRPEPGDVLGRTVHTPVDEVSAFSCSEPFYEQLDRAMRRTLLNNLHGIPTDTPMYEKNGWTGDAQLGAPSLAYAFDVHRFLAKWLDDLKDSQTADGQMPVIVPSGGWGYADLAPSPEWTTVYPFLVREMYRVYGDDSIARQHWPVLTRYLDWEIDHLVDGLAVTALGDYLPPGYGGNPPEDTRLTATAYLHRALVGTAEMGELLGKDEVAARYRAVAAGLKDAFNAEFLNDAGYYSTTKDPDYRQTSNALPLAFGLAPAGARASVLDSLVADIAERGNHLNTGALGTSVLLRVLSSHGHPDVAHAIATQRTYPSWGYWFDNGADTMWEMWQLDSRSRDHYFQGTVTQWLYENVAGLRPGDNGYRTFTVRPDARTGVTWARTSIRTVRGTASVAWSKVGRDLRLTVRVPVGSTAEIHVPADRRDRVTSPKSARHIRTEPGFEVYHAGHGSWDFVARG